MASTPSSGSDPCDATPRVSTSSQTNPLCATQRSSPVGSVTIAASARHVADDVLHADRGELFVGDRGDDHVAAQPESGCFAPGKHDRGEARLHVVRATSVESRAVDARRPGLGHAARADDVHVRVEHERSAATTAAGNRDHVGAAGAELVQLDVEPRALEPAGDEPGDLRFAGATRHQIRVCRVDRHQIRRSAPRPRRTKSSSWAVPHRWCLSVATVHKLVAGACNRSRNARGETTWTPW